MEPSPSASQPTPNHRSTPTPNESAGSSHHAFRSTTITTTTTKDTKGLNYNTLHMHVAEQNYRILHLHRLNNSISSTIAHVHTSVQAELSTDPPLAAVLDRYKQRQRHLAAQIDVIKDVNDSLRASIEKAVSNMTEAAKRRERAEFAHLGGLLESLRCRLGAMEENLVVHGSGVDLFARKLPGFLVLTKQAMAVAKSNTEEEANDDGTSDKEERMTNDGESNSEGTLDKQYESTNEEKSETEDESSEDDKSSNGDEANDEDESNDTDEWETEDESSNEDEPIMEDKSSNDNESSDGEKSSEEDKPSNTRQREVKED
ncbi:hypothetical protein IWZ01DRAFT_557587 [Phyllosticta capitalensis]